MPLSDDPVAFEIATARLFPGEQLLWAGRFEPRAVAIITIVYAIMFTVGTFLQPNGPVALWNHPIRLFPILFGYAFTVTVNLVLKGAVYAVTDRRMLRIFTRVIHRVNEYPFLTETGAPMGSSQRIDRFFYGRRGADVYKIRLAAQAKLLEDTDESARRRDA